MQLLFGINSVLGRLQSAKGARKLLLRQGELPSRLDSALELARVHGIQVQRVSIEELDALTKVNHQGVGLEVDSLKALDESALDGILASPEKNPLLLILDGVTDPRNLGACLRSAATLGVDAVIQPKDRSAALNDGAIKTASGAASAVPVIEVVNLARTMVDIQARGVWIVGTTLDAPEPLGNIDLTGPIAIVMGSEDKGIRTRTAKTCDYLATIPMVVGDFGFNVSVATGICLYEVVRQRQSV